MPGTTDLILIRHAPARSGGRLAGRLDVPADLPGPEVLARARALVGRVAKLVVSPALRCRMTAAALFPGLAAMQDERLWEQHFGEWEGMEAAKVPDLGPLTRMDLARHRPPGGESFHDICARIAPALSEAATLKGPVAIVAHAGTVRAALALATGSIPAALAFEVAPLSATLIRALPGGQWSIQNVNRALK
ncbi:glucosyl-3-phosphoglycerate phosphatase [mine drainage metagenome]|uniref:Glucosyl-3-phosphoglycerate phosphatase n=1 Tax=mine drainage metagenome TaxID=410659 RepID=A0A1J5PIX8_9ZZZZ